MIGRANFKLRITNYEWGEHLPHSSLVIFYWLCLLLILGIAVPVRAQVGHIVTIRPDRAAPGMNVVVEVLARDSDVRPFGYDVLDSSVSVVLANPSDTNRVRIGPPIVSWNGRVIQIPLFIFASASLGPVPFSTFSILTGQSNTVDFYIDSLQHLGPITHDTTIGGGFGALSANNTLLMDSLIVTNAKVHFSLVNPDTTSGNPRFLPVVILSKGPVRLTNSTLSVDADSLDGGPGGGGGGHGFGGIDGGIGGSGFTGGGSCPTAILGSTGSGSNGNYLVGGQAVTGITGGGSDPSDQGGGGGTGAPYCASGAAGLGNLPSPAGGVGGGAGGGENPNPFIEFGGGGGGFGTEGSGGGDPAGEGLNGGTPTGGRFLAPLCGGSGGGAGNSVNLDDGALGGSGGGGGGALELISFDTIVVQSSTLSALGASGTNGVKIAAGGGGGSGGAIYLASSTGIHAVASGFDILGGNAGNPASDSVGYAGGAGGLGRVRIDGLSNLTPSRQLSPVWSEGISLLPGSSGLPANGYFQITGYAPDLLNTLDTVRIYYRTDHTAWQSVDTLRSSDGTWSKWLPLTHDSLIDVVAFVEVNRPASNPPYLYEPTWLVSSASMGVISHPATPLMVVQDTLDFGTVQNGKCKKLLLHITNDGEAPLIIQDPTLSGSLRFSLPVDTPILIPPYSTDTLEVQFCPDTAGSNSGFLTFLSNDSTDSPKRITLLGTGLNRRDSLLLSPTSINFGKVLIGECESDTVLLRSVGVDTLYLDRSVWNVPPFIVRVIPSNTAIAPGLHVNLVITFCPADSGAFGATLVLDERQDSISADGEGIERLAASIGEKMLGTSCLGDTITFDDTISNLGNDTITILQWRGSHSGSGGSIGAVLQPRGRLAVHIGLGADSLGLFSDTIRYQLSDTTLTTVLSYRVAGIAIHFDSMLSLPLVCVGASDTVVDSITNLGPDTLTVPEFRLLKGGDFTLLDSSEIIPAGQRISFRTAFHPGFGDTVVQSDTLQITLSDAGCDSVIEIILTGTGSNNGLAAKAIDFDSVLVKNCRDDSVLIQDPCGLPITIDSIRSKNGSFQLLDSLPIVVPMGTSFELSFRFCPLDTGAEVDTIIMYPNGGPPFPVVMRGTGYQQANPWAHFTISSVAARAGEHVSTTITLDSSSLEGERLTHFGIRYDPGVVFSEGGSPFEVLPSAPDSLAFTDLIDFSKPGFIDSLEWMTLLGPTASTAIQLLLSTDTAVNITVIPGQITVTDCTGLNGQFAPGGVYGIGPIVPNPALDIASFALQLGNDGFVEAGIYDLTGKYIERILSQSMNRGNFDVSIPTGGISSGRYMLVVRSLGWMAFRPLIVGH